MYSAVFDQLRARKLPSSTTWPNLQLISSRLISSKQHLKQYPVHTAPPAMPRRRRPGRAEERYYTFPSLHEDVSALLEEDDLYFAFREKDDPAGSLKEYDTNIMGRFVCRNDGCNSNGWSSKKIAITIRMYPGAEYNARVYNQRCRGCDALGDLVLESGGSYADRVAYRIKKWCGVYMEPPTYLKGQGKGPHQSDRCEGCKAGRCKEGGFDGV